MAESVATALDSQGCAVCDGFLSIDEVRGVRAEIKALEHHYKASEIWVGKNSREDVDALDSRNENAARCGCTVSTRH